MEHKVGETIFEYINNALDWLSESDCGACNLWLGSDLIPRVDIEWNDGISSFNLNEVLDLIKEKGHLTKDDLWECQK